MKKLKKCFLCFAVALCIALMGSLNAFADGHETFSSGTDEIPYHSYTYWVGYNADEKNHAYSKPMYEVNRVISRDELGAEPDSKINDVFTDENGNIYVLDSGVSKIYVLNGNYELINTVSSISYNGESLIFTDAKGVYAKNNLIYIADTENARVIVVDGSGAVSDMLLLPESNLIPTGFNYRPTKIVIDSKGYTYIASDGSYYGAILYSPEREFLGFFGANTVKASVTDVIKSVWNRLFSNDVKRAADVIALPYTFTDIVLGPDDFIYTSTGRSDGSNIQEDKQRGQICRLNPGGKNVLNAEGWNFADLYVGGLERQLQVQDLFGLDVDENGFFYAVDSTYGRIFWYDADCNLLSVFGGSLGDGNQNGTFGLSSGISINNGDIVISDSQKNSITIFSRTVYGDLVYEAQNITLSGDFAAARKLWEEVIKQDINNQLAYVGLAKAYYDSGDNDKAMQYAKLGMDRETYAKAFENKRSEFLEKYFVLFVGIAIVLIAGLVALRLWLKKRGTVLIKNVALKTAFSSVLHPVESFRLVKEKKQGSVIIASVLLVLFYLVTVLADTNGGFAFTVFDSGSYNSVYVLLSTVGLVFLWSIANWLVCTLASGIGTLKEIYTVTCYCLIPVIFGRILFLVLSHILVPKEGAFLGIFMTVCTLYALFMLIIGIMRIHDYEFGKFVGTTIFTIVGMLIMIFLLFLIFLLSQQVFGWVKTVIIEFRYR